MTPGQTKKDRRLAALMEWLGGIDAVAGAELSPASDDASFRRYFRVQTGPTGQGSFIVMDAPPEQEDCRPFIRIAGYLEAMRLNAPRIIEANPEDGFLLITDLGSRRYLDTLLEDPAAAPAMYADALHALRLLQKRGTAYQSSLPPYDEDLLRFELSIFRDWLYEKHLGLTFTDEEEGCWQGVCDLPVR
ncbi:MAG: aminoglycoside phosphotransferase, partial [Bacteroidetes bacterium]|nr:aminoglycoside phosphotransferase [Bacteroidota bacterium]